MDTASDYKITNPYNPPIHNGVDRAMPIGVPIVINSVVVAYSGNTGKSTGPHVHSQAGTDAACQNVVDPRPYEFKPGTVTAIRTTDPYKPGQKGGEWGRYITIKTLSGKYITYAHLSQVNVKVGQVIEEDDVITRGRAIRLLRLTRRGTSEKKIQALMQKNEDVWLDEVYRADWFEQQTKDMAEGKLIEPYTGSQLYVRKG